MVSGSERHRRFGKGWTSAEHMTFVADDRLGVRSSAKQYAKHLGYTAYN